MDADALQSLDRRFHYGFAAAMLTGTLAWVLAPGDVVLVSLVGLPVVIFFGAATIGVANGQWTEAAGYLVATVGWCLVLASVVDQSPEFPAGTGVSDPVSLAGFGLTALGSAVSLLADHGDRLGALVSRSE